MRAGRHDRLPDVGSLRLVVAVTDPMALLLLRGQLAAARTAGFDVTVISGPGKQAARIAAAENVRHIAVAMERGISPWRDVRSLWRLYGVLRALEPDIVNASTPKAGLLVTLAARLAGVPGRIHTLRGLRFETTTGATRILLMAMTWLTCGLARRVICISPSLRQKAIASGVVSADKAVVLGAGSSNGIDVARFTATAAMREQAGQLRRSVGIPPTVPVLGFVGRIARDKGIVELVEAWRSLRKNFADLHWLVLGPADPTDPVTPAIHAELHRDPRIHWLGRHDDVVPAYLAMDLLALPTYREGFGNVLIEAAALEIATVATRVTGCVDAVADGVTGTLVAPRDARALERAIEAYLRDPERRVEHGRAGRARVRELFDHNLLWDHLHREYRALGRAAGVAREF